MDTLALDPGTWDLTLDVQGNLATFGDATPMQDATGAGMRLAQDVATRCLAWRGEVYFDTQQGIRYASILGLAPNLSVLQNAYNIEALNVPGCQTAVAAFTFTAGTQRKLVGELNVSDGVATGTVVVT